MLDTLNRQRWPLLAALALGLYLKFLLPATAILFYELHHLTGVDAIYWGYSGFKLAGYYFGEWRYQSAACAAAAVLLFLLLAWQRNCRGRADK